MLEQLIDKDSPIPVYHQIVSELRRRMVTEMWKTGDKLPSENELAEEYGVSRITLRQALGVLESEGIIKKRKGLGAFIASNPRPIIQDFSLPSALGKKLHDEGIDIEPQIVSLVWLDPIPSINAELRIDGHDRLAYAERLFMYHNRPIALNRSWLPARLVPNIVEKGLIGNHLSVTLASAYHIQPVSIHNTVEAGYCSPADMKLLRIAFQTPVILITSTSFDAARTPIEFSRTAWLGEQVRFHFNID